MISLQVYFSPILFSSNLYIIESEKRKKEGEKYSNLKNNSDYSKYVNQRNNGWHNTGWGTSGEYQYIINSKLTNEDEIGNLLHTDPFNIVDSSGIGYAYLMNSDERNNYLYI